MTDTGRITFGPPHSHFPAWPFTCLDCGRHVPGRAGGFSVTDGAICYRGLRKRVQSAYDTPGNTDPAGREVPDLADVAASLSALRLKVDALAELIRDLGEVVGGLVRITRFSAALPTKGGG